MFKFRRARSPPVPRVYQGAPVRLKDGLRFSHRRAWIDRARAFPI